MLKLFLYVALLNSFILFPAATGQDIKYIAIPQLEKILSNQDDQIHVLNFWATWCGPCVREFPLFEKVSKEFKGRNVKFLMVSLDFPSQVQSQLIPFLEKNKTSLDVAVMTDVDYNEWIDKQSRCFMAGRHSCDSGLQ